MNRHPSTRRLHLSTRATFFVASFALLASAAALPLLSASCATQQRKPDGPEAAVPSEPNRPAPAGYRLRLAVAAAARDGDQDATATLVRQAPAHGLDVAELLAVAEAHWPTPRLHRRAWRAGRRWTAAQVRRHRPR